VNGLSVGPKPNKRRKPIPIRINITGRKINFFCSRIILKIIVKISIRALHMPSN